MSTIITNVMHGTPDPNIEFTFTEDRVAYFTNSLELASNFATCKDFGGLLKGEKATIIYADITISNPLILNADNWEEIADSTYINKDELISQGYDGIICADPPEYSYYVIFDQHQLNINNKIHL